MSSKAVPARTASAEMRRSAISQPRQTRPPRMSFPFRVNSDRRPATSAPQGLSRVIAALFSSRNLSRDLNSLFRVPAK